MLYINKKMLNELAKKNLKENKKNADKIIKDIVENTILIEENTRLKEKIKKLNSSIEHDNFEQDDEMEF